jgi:hypothetical protein
MLLWLAWDEIDVELLLLLLLANALDELNPLFENLS